MQTFKDTTGHEWRLQFNRKRVRERLDIDLPREVKRLAADPALLMGTIFCCCRPDIEPELFAERVAPVMEQATDALLVELRCH